ncbi:uncharacterized protein BDR25DRAFT_282396 [Lindgomyces ingoldianus]|uniref:Uncharacterized protein n=1 Tax=Lindgomyces ingoldianus TaxID=673940 RepID=A0ACB6R3N8_9PLEO|nr:uncharacterized protein BDR25DRAFT_282396 [Lindgomyces ingoldianus]KAF2473127.1 hypothetical protein BDR25DRAFT_282396 [Lindgomyces ingoldianus]
MASRGGRGGRGGRSGTARAPPGTVRIAGVEMAWDLTGLELKKSPTERFPKTSNPPPPPPTAAEKAMHQRLVTLRDRIHDGPLYTVLGDGMKTGLKRKAEDPAPTEASLFNPFTDNLTYSAKYMKVRRRIPRLDTRPYVVDLFPEELRSILSHTTGTTNGTADDGRPTKKPKLLQLSKVTAVSRIEQYLKEEETRALEEKERAEAEEELDEDAEENEEEEEYDEKPDAIDEDDNWSAPSTDSEESDDDYNAEQYFDNGEDDYGGDEGVDENTYE